MDAKVVINEQETKSLVSKSLLSHLMTGATIPWKKEGECIVSEINLNDILSPDIKKSITEKIADGKFTLTEKADATTPQNSDAAPAPANEYGVLNMLKKFGGRKKSPATGSAQIVDNIGLTKILQDALKSHNREKDFADLDKICKKAAESVFKKFDPADAALLSELSTYKDFTKAVALIREIQAQIEKDIKKSF